ncbi:hypothetical protein [Pedobacter sp. BMA]|uniref:hypothetical protein n=1 Tax=Pedobacter sp. BMA TaxID=1663685 RepID=UPI00064B4294|nr:hypothetical protein [Pedobacter sp. BMA]KLT63757.1 hypothetical protein AB669_20120 [Pedobacter sp. BMA]
MLHRPILTSFNPYLALTFSTRFSNFCSGALAELFGSSSGNLVTRFGKCSGKLRETSRKTGRKLLEKFGAGSARSRMGAERSQMTTRSFLEFGMKLSVNKAIGSPVVSQ